MGQIDPDEAAGPGSPALPAGGVHRVAPSRNPFGRHGWWLASAVLVSLSVLVLAVLHSARAVNSADRAERDGALARSAHQVADGVLLDLLDAQTGQRGFLLTGDRGFLLPYERAVASLPGRLATLAELAGPDQQRSAATVTWLAGRTLDELAASTALRDGSSASAAALVATGQGTPVMDQIRAEADALVAATDEAALASSVFADGERTVAQRTVVAAAVFLAGNLLALLVVLRQRGAWERQREALLRDLETLASRDALTGLFNRRLLHERLELAVARSLHSSTRSGADTATDVAVAYLDLNAFKPVNDELGHDVGDSVLKQLAGQLTGSIRSGDTLARVGGDEFVVVMEDVCGELDLEAVRLRLVGACTLAVPGLARGGGAVGAEHQVTASIGVATLRGVLAPTGPGGAGPSHADVTDGASRLLAAADAAMYAEKRARSPLARVGPVPMVAAGCGP